VRHHDLAQLNIGRLVAPTDSPLVDALADFVYRSAHAPFLRRRREWFERMDETYSVLWWVPAGHRPTVSEAIERLDHLRKHGATPSAFTFRHRFTADEEVEVADPRDVCSV